ncbi:unnamed protein product [Ceutorhynchus assimilis]|uniref:Pectinesterase n=1 Tax=Ceutorhynchus assimilis TaxID=467358 RepID=A0A9N9MFR5_9CUCU|nr:unnamed protein product [Ceutorhynchus assimilis]
MKSILAILFIAACSEANQTPPGTRLRPILNPREAAAFTPASFLQGWAPPTPILRPADFKVGAPGGFGTLQEAIDAAIRTNSPTRKYIYINPGRYQQVAYIPPTRVPLTIYGSSEATTFITFDLSPATTGGSYGALVGKFFPPASTAHGIFASCASRPIIGTSCSNVLRVDADGVELIHLTIENFSKRPGSDQAVALTIEADRVQADRRSDTGVIFAPSTPDHKFGFLVIGSTITGDPAFFATHHGFLARTWDAGQPRNGQVIIKNSKLDPVFNVAAPYAASTTGRAYNGNAAPVRDVNDPRFARFYECSILFIAACSEANQTPPGTRLRPILNPREAAAFTPASFLQGWAPPTPILRPADFKVGAPGGFGTLQEAIDAAIRTNSPTRKYIYINPGRYQQVAYIPPTRVPLTIYGSSEATIFITFDLSPATTGGSYGALVGKFFPPASTAHGIFASCASRPIIGTSCSNVLRVDADGVEFIHLTIENFSKRPGSDQAVALTIEADRVQADRRSDTGVIFAPSTPDHKFGFLVIGSTITGDPAFFATHHGFLARTWDAGQPRNGQVIIKNSKLDPVFNVAAPYAASTTGRAYNGNAAPVRDVNDPRQTRHSSLKGYGGIWEPKWHYVIRRRRINISRDKRF